MIEIIEFIVWTILWFAIGYLVGMVGICIFLYKE